MKKELLLMMLFMGMFNSILAQEGSTIVDDAAQGSGPNQFNYVGAWTHSTNTVEPYFNNTVSFSNQSQDYVTVNFAGHRIALFGAKGPHLGMLGITLDNEPEVIVDAYSSVQEDAIIIFGTSILTVENHTLKIRVTGTKNPASTNTYVYIDNLIVYHDTPENNTITGVNALFSNTSGYYNTANGYFALNGNTTGYLNTAVGHHVMLNNSIGASNVAVGGIALLHNQDGNENTAVGTSSSYNNISGSKNTSIGFEALYANQASDNTALGNSALRMNTTGYGNSAMGLTALKSNQTGTHNTAVGMASLARNVNGNMNTAIGAYAGGMVLQPSQYPQYSNTTAIGALATPTASNQVRIGNSSVTSIGGQVHWSVLSDGRFKKDIKEDVSGLDFISKLRPVSYTVDKDAVDKFLKIPDNVRNSDPEARKKIVRQTGFVAQEVEEVIKKTGYVFHGVDAPQNEGDHYNIRYGEFVVPLVKAVQELNTLLKEQSVQHAAEIAELKEQLKSYEGSGKGLSATETLLHQNNPNPFSIDTEIKMSLPESTVNATVIVYNMEGRQLKELSVKGRGETGVKISASELHAGMYLYALIVDGKVIDTKRMILTK